MAQTALDGARERDKVYWASDVYHNVANDYKGTERSLLDSRPIAGEEAMFSNYDHGLLQRSNNPGGSFYMRMHDYNSARDFIEETRRSRKQKVNEFNKKYDSVSSFIVDAAKKKDKRVDLDIRPYPNPIFRNYDYTEEGPNETSPGGGLYHGRMDKYKSVGDFLNKNRKSRRKARKKALEDMG